jgi:transcriptional regulator of acetoin/glycerol metabolism
MGVVLPVPARVAPAPTVPPVPPAATDGAAGVGASDERARIVDALDRCAGNQSHAAKLLGISRGTLIKRIEEYSIRRPRKRDDDGA